LRSVGIRYLATALVTGLLIAVLPGCGGESEPALIASAKSLLERKDPKSAIIQLKTALQKNPQSGQARLLLGQVLLDACDADGAALELDKAAELRFDDNHVLPLLAKALLATGQVKKVSDRFATAKLSDPKAAAALGTAVGAAYAAQGLISQSQAAIDGALQQDPRNVAARLLRIRLTAGRKAFDDAITQVEALIADDPKQAEAWMLKGELLWIAKADIEGAVKAFEQALVADAKQVQAHAALIQLALRQGDMVGFRTRIKALRVALPNSFQARFYAAQVALVDKDLKAAQEGVQQLIKMAPEYPPVLQLAGTIELRSGLLSQAQAHLAQAVQLAPDVPAARALLAEAQLRAGQPAKTLATLKPLLEAPVPHADVLGLAAQAYLHDGDLTQAESYFSRAAKASPEDSQARVALAVAQLSKGNTGAGLAQLESLASSDKSTYADLALISALVRGKDVDAALKAVDRLQRKVPDQPLPYLLRGRIALVRNDRVGARASLEAALAKDPVYFAAVSELAGIDLAEGRLDEARKRFETVVAREPNNFRARLAVANVRQRAGAKPEEIASLLADAVKVSPSEFEPRLALIQHELALHHGKAALAVAQDAVAALPDNLLLLDALGRSQLAAGDSMQAINTFQKIAAAQSTMPEPYLRLAEVRMASKDYAAAVKDLQRALEVAPKLLAAQRALIQVHLMRKKAGEALQVARQVQKQRPGEAAGYLLEGEIHAGQRAWDPAIQAFRAALQRERSTEMAIRLHALYSLAERDTDAAQFASAWERERPRDAGFFFHLGTMAMERKNYDVADARYRQVLDVFPDNAAALNNRAWILAKQGKPGALALAERANNLAPGQPAYMDTLAAVLASEHDMKKALEVQRQVVAAAPGVPAYALNLAKLLIQAGERSQARAELDKLAALGGRFNGQDEVASLLKGL
jgi:putative PEP-CTERM system TPR-repeat lipoprotein